MEVQAEVAAHGGLRVRDIVAREVGDGKAIFAPLIELQFHRVHPLDNCISASLDRYLLRLFQRHCRGPTAFCAARKTYVRNSPTRRCLNFRWRAVGSSHP